MRRVFFYWLAACLMTISMMLPQSQAMAATSPLVASITTVGLDGKVGTIFGWLDQSYTSAVNSTITNRTLTFWGSSNWTGYDQYGNLITGNTNKKTYTVANAPVQLITPGTYYYQLTDQDSANNSGSTSQLSFTLSDPLPATTVSTISSTGVNSVSANVGFSVSAGSASTATANGAKVTLNRYEPFVVYDATSGNVSTENWSLTSSATWTGTTGVGSVSGGTWTMSRSSGVHYVSPWSEQVLVSAAWKETVIVSVWCSGYDDENPKQWFSHAGYCTAPWNTPTITYGYIDHPAVYETVYHSGYWAYGSWSNPDPNMIDSLSTAGIYTLSETDSKVTYAIDLQVDPYRGGLADFTMQRNEIGTTELLSNLGIATSGDLTGATETWYVFCSQGLKTYTSLSALNADKFSVLNDMGATVAHEVKINNQTYVSYNTFVVKKIAFVTTPGLVQVTQILYPASGQTYPTYNVPVSVKAGGEVTYQVQTIGIVTSVSATYSDGQTQQLQQSSPGTWVGYYYPSSTQTIPVTTPNGTTVSITTLKATAPDGESISAQSRLLTVSGTNSSSGGSIYPPKIID